ncbi:homeobox-leucine zipper protein HDG1-like isoform X2 [Solanum pennellii]|nr:homeobox-leucine zipper protein HDG1-like isoform X2 [Solanum pennellii]XP_027773419.1 homeobox-leucine zipper protein HDG1-like isoform X2 [Solanum pennellii]
MELTNNRDGGVSGDALTSPDGSSERRHKFSVNQIHELESVFKVSSHPDEKTKQELATKFSVDKKQVQFWFQNKRSISKTQSERYNKRVLQQENEKLRIEYAAMREVMKNSICDPCRNKDTTRNENVDEKEILNEHARLKNELAKIAIHADKSLGSSSFLEGSLTSMMENFGLELNEVDFGKYLSSPLPTNLDVTLDKSMLLNLALDALNELLKLAMSDEPLWVRNLDGGGETLNMEEYATTFIPIIGIKPSHFTTEATRSSATVVGNSLTLVEMLMNESQWVEAFPCIIGKVNTFDVISTGIGEGKSGTLLLIEAELQIISNVVPVREIQFLRFCQKHAEDSWIIVDVSVDTIKEGSQQYKIEKCRRLPSGCIIQDMSNGYSKVTWIEHMEYDEIFVDHLYRPLIRAGLGFGAQRWMSSLQRQSEFLRVMASFVNSTVDSKGEIGMGTLSQRMTRSFCAVICATSHKWITIQKENGKDANLMMRRNISDAGEPIGVILSATKTIQLPIKSQCLFQFFTNTNLRRQWDILSCSGAMENIIHITKGENLESSVSLLCANGGANENNMMIFQDTCTDATGSLLVYAIVDSSKMNTVMKGGDPSCVELLPNGISILPDLSANNNKEFGSGSLVTIMFQMLVDNISTADLPQKSIVDANDIISHTIHKIKTALLI